MSVRQQTTLFTLLETTKREAKKSQERQELQLLNIQKELEELRSRQALELQRAQEDAEYKCSEVQVCLLKISQVLDCSYPVHSH